MQRRLLHRFQKFTKSTSWIFAILLRVQMRFSGVKKLLSKTLAVFCLISRMKCWDCDAHFILWKFSNKLKYYCTNFKNLHQSAFADPFENNSKAFYIHIELRSISDFSTPSLLIQDRNHSKYSFCRPQAPTANISTYFKKAKGGTLLFYQNFLSIIGLRLRTWPQFVLQKIQ